MLTLSQILDSCNVKEFADHNFKFDESGRKFSKGVEYTGKRSDISFSHIVFKRLVLQTH